MILEGDVIVNVTLDPVPDAGTLPLPVQPVQTCCVPVGPDAGDVTEAVMLAPESNHPLIGFGEPKGEVTENLYCVL